jgi:hypothetical protein
MDTVRRDVQIAGQTVDADTERLHELFVKNLTRMDWSEQFHSLGHGASVITADFNAAGVATAPDQTNPPLIVDPDAVLPGPVPFEGLEPVAGRNAKIKRNALWRRGRDFMDDSLKCLVPASGLLSGLNLRGPPGSDPGE